MLRKRPSAFWQLIIREPTQSTKFAHCAFCARLKRPGCSMGKGRPPRVLNVQRKQQWHTSTRATARTGNSNVKTAPLTSRDATSARLRTICEAGIVRRSWGGGGGGASSGLTHGQSSAVTMPARAWLWFVRKMCSRRHSCYRQLLAGGSTSRRAVAWRCIMLR